MTIKRISLLSFLITILVWGCFSWPLPRYFTSGVPAAAHMEPAQVQVMVPGDHLQFMYYCWLAGDMVFGKTPLFCNLYEFNTGGEKNGYRPDAYYFPFSLIYSVFALAGQSARLQRYTQHFGQASFGSVAVDGRALGWNLTGFLTLWLTYLLTWLLVRRYTTQDWIAACAALIAITLPFRWINLCGGSPAGFAIMWIPAIFLGIDLAIRDGSIAGGILAGVSILFASWTDNHIFFFGTLAAPGWAGIAFAAGARTASKRQISLQNIFLALLPIPLFAGAALAFPTLMQQIAGTSGGAAQHLSASVGARTWREVGLYSPIRYGLFSWLPLGVSDHIYIGFIVPVLLAVGTICLTISAVRQRPADRRRLLILCFLLAGIAGVIVLAVGTHGPIHGLILRICRKIIPPYALIRQPAKIFCLMPTLLAVAAGLSLSAILFHFKNPRAKILLALLFCGAIAAEYMPRVHPTISILDTKQEAYEAAANDAASSGKSAHALIVPLWPGDAHYSSIYQYYASLYRLKMVNGYNPFVSKSYFENVFRRYESVNQGWLAEDQINELLRRGIDYIILHEDLFPEKVSPFPVGFTLQRLLEHNRLKLVKQAGRVWVFKLLSDDVGISLDEALQKTLNAQHSTSNAELGSVRSKLKVESWKFNISKSMGVKSEPVPWSPFGSARHWQAEACVLGKAKIVKALSPAGVSYVTLNTSGAGVSIPGLRMAPTPQTQWMLRVKGEGALYAETLVSGRASYCDILDIESDDWTWITIPLGDFNAFALTGLKIEYECGSIDCDRILLAAEDWNFTLADADETIFLPAPGMFHAGYTSLSDNTVVIEKDRDPPRLIFYGPKLPLDKGRYCIELVFSSKAPRGTLLGQFNIKRYDRDPSVNWVPVVSGTQSFAEFTVYQNLPMWLEFQFLGQADLKISGIRLTRLE